ncbi:MAG TPA: thioredoxin family protein [Bacteroidales bacterium]|nr:thioredoxin family protein [Bacteroidales bacterium]
MKKTIFYLMIGCLWIQPLLGQQLNRVVTDTTLHTEVLIDTSNRAGLTGQVFGAFYQQEYATYSADAEIIRLIGGKLNDYHLTVVMGSWCSDSQEQVPRFIKILDQLHFPEDRMTIICVDRKKKTILTDIQPLNIQLVPTFIFYREGAEAGRIVETPAETLEKDILRIVTMP